MSDVETGGWKKKEVYTSGEKLTNLLLSIFYHLFFFIKPPSLEDVFLLRSFLLQTVYGDVPQGEKFLYVMRRVDRKFVDTESDNPYHLIAKKKLLSLYKSYRFGNLSDEGYIELYNMAMKEFYEQVKNSNKNITGQVRDIRFVTGLSALGR